MESQLNPPERAALRLSRTHITILLVMLAVVAMFAWATWSARSLVVTFVPQVNAAMQSRVSVTEAHLWLEEIVSGDATEDPEQVWDKIDEARWFLDAMLKGGERAGQTFLPVDDKALHADLLLAQAVLRRFEELAHTRVDVVRSVPVPVEAETGLAGPGFSAGAVGAGEASDLSEEPAAAVETIAEPATLSAGVGSDIDSRFDDTFEEFFVATERIEEHLQAVIERALAVFIATQLALITAVIVLFVWIVWLLVRKEAMARDEHVSTLQASLDRLAQSQSELERQNALRGAMVEISDSLQGIDNPAEIARIALNVLCARTGAAVGIFWAYRAGAGLSRLAAHALPPERSGMMTLEEGEGLAGRAAQDQQVLVVDVPSDYLPITSALGASPAPHLRVLPLVHDRVTVGVLEFAFIEHPDDDVAGLLTAVAPALAVRLYMSART